MDPRLFSFYICITVMLIQKLIQYFHAIRTVPLILFYTDKNPGSRASYKKRYFETIYIILYERKPRSIKERIRSIRLNDNQLFSMNGVKWRWKSEKTINLPLRQYPSAAQNFTHGGHYSIRNFKNKIKICI